MYSTQSSLGHINLMLDTFIANANANDLKAIIRRTLATCPSSTSSFIDAARKRMEQNRAKTPIPSEGLFTTSANGLAFPGPALKDTLSAVRSTYGVGLGFTSLQKLAAIIRTTVGLRWNREGEMEDILSAIDSDVTQAIQSSKEELQGGRVVDRKDAIATVAELSSALKESRLDTESWGADFPFEKAAGSLEYWHL